MKPGKVWNTMVGLFPPCCHDSDVEHTRLPMSPNNPTGAYFFLSWQFCWWAMPERKFALSADHSFWEFSLSDDHNRWQDCVIHQNGDQVQQLCVGLSSHTDSPQERVGSVRHTMIYCSSFSTVKRITLAGNWRLNWLCLFSFSCRH